MKLAEALLLRSEYQKKIDSLQQRIMEQPKGTGEREALRGSKLSFG